VVSQKGKQTKNGKRWNRTHTEENKEAKRGDKGQKE
jgi:hypothetical protein